MLSKLWELFYTFARVGITTFGGGYAMLPILHRENRGEERLGHGRRNGRLLRHRTMYARHHRRQCGHLYRPQGSRYHRRY